MAGDYTTEESEADMDDQRIELKECRIELSDLELKVALDANAADESEVEMMGNHSEFSGVEQETTTGESDIEVDDEWERAMTNSTATAGSLKMVACPYDGCPWFSSKPKRLPRHLLTHTGERPFACQVAPLFNIK